MRLKTPLTQLIPSGDELPVNANQRHRTGGRILWVEAARWIAAVAVVLQHALFPLTIQSIAMSDISTAWLLNAFLRFPVPVFFFLSGFVSGLGLENGGPPRYFTRALRTALPYIAYSVFYTALSVISGRAASLSPRYLISRVLMADDAAHLWFLASLTIIGVIGVALWRRFGDWFALIAVLVSIVSGSLYSYSMVLHSPASSAVRLVLVPLGIYAAGLWWARHRQERAGRGRAGLVAVLAGVSLLLSVVEMYVAELYLQPHWTVDQQCYASLSLGAILMSVSCDLRADSLQQLRAVDWLAVLPPVTLGVYCVHQAFLSYLPPLGDLTRWNSASALLAGFIAATLSALIVSVLARSRLLRPLVM